MSQQKILIVEDDLSIRDLLNQFFKLKGYQTIVAEDGLSGLRLFLNHRPDYVLSDIRMPALSGLGLLEEVRKIDSKVCFVLMTGYNQETTVLQALKNGASNFFYKPLQLSEISDWISSTRSQHREDSNTLAVLVHRCFLQFRSGQFHLETISQELTRFLGNNLSEVEKRNVCVGLEEALVNAQEHGNLEISSAEKSQWSEMGTYPENYSQRLEKFSNRLLSVDLKQDRLGWRLWIGDEGAGFEWAKWLKTDHLPPPGGSGRGITLIKAFFDEVEYNTRGNEVVLTKRFPENQRNSLPFK